MTSLKNIYRNKAQFDLFGYSLHITVVNFFSKNCLPCQIWHTGPLSKDARSVTQVLYPGISDLAHKSSTEGCQIWRTRPLPRDARSGTQVFSTEGCKNWHTSPLPRDARSGTQVLYPGIPDLATSPLPRDARSGTLVLYPGMPDLAHKSSTQGYQIWNASIHKCEAYDNLDGNRYF